jgi:hypothetical protein
MLRKIGPVFEDRTDPGIRRGKAKWLESSVE